MKNLQCHGKKRKKNKRQTTVLPQNTTLKFAVHFGLEVFVSLFVNVSIPGSTCMINISPNNYKKYDILKRNYIFFL